MFINIKNIRNKSIIIRVFCALLIAIAVLFVYEKRNEIALFAYEKRNEIIFFAYSVMGSNLPEGETLTTADVAGIIDKEGRFTLETGYSFTKYKSYSKIQVFYNDESLMNDKYLDAQLLKLSSERGKVMSFLGMQTGDIEQTKIFVFDWNRQEFQKNLIYYRGENADFTDKIAMENVLFTATLPLSFYDLAELTAKQYLENYSMPQWLSTGITVWACEKYNKGYGKLNISIESPGDKIDFDRLSTDRKYAKGYGHILVDFIIEKFGKEKLLEVAKSGSLDVLNISQSNLQNRFKEFESNVTSWSDSLDNKDYLSEINRKGFTKWKYGIANECIVSEHFQVFYNDIIFPSGEEAKRLVGYLEKGYLYVLNFFDVKPEQMPIVKVFLVENMETLDFAGLTMFQNFFCVKYYNGGVQYPEMQLQKNALHEFVHCVYTVKQSLNNKRSRLSWLSEGLASSISYNLSENHLLFFVEGLPIMTMLRENDFNCDNNVLDDSETEIFIKTQSDYYMFGASIINYLYDYKGVEAVRELIENPNDFAEIVDMPLREFSRKLAEYIMDRYN